MNNSQENPKFGQKLLKSKFVRSAGMLAGATTLVVAAPNAAHAANNGQARTEISSAPTPDKAPTTTDVPVSVPGGETVTPINPTETTTSSTTTPTTEKAPNTTTTFVDIGTAIHKEPSPTTTTNGNVTTTTYINTGGPGGGISKTLTPTTYIDTGGPSGGISETVPPTTELNGSDGSGAIHEDFLPATNVLPHTGSPDGTPLEIGGAVAAAGLGAAEIARRRGQTQQIALGLPTNEQH